MAFCSKCGTQLSDGAKFCPKCGNSSISMLNVCPKCGKHMRSGAKFCPKCGNPIMNSSAKESLSDDSTNNINEDTLRNETYPQTNVENVSKRKKWIGFGVSLVAFFAVLYLLAMLGDKSNSEGIKQQTGQTQKSVVKSPSIDKPTRQEDDSEKQREAEFQQKTMEYANQIQQIMNNMNTIFNNYLATSGYDNINHSRGVNASADISDLHWRGVEIFEKMIDLARKYRNQDAVNAFKNEKKDFDDKWHEMDKYIHDDIYN